jgi:hypothetical protein
VAVLAGIALAVAACSSGDDDGDDAAGSSQPAATAEASDATGATGTAATDATGASAAADPEAVKRYGYGPAEVPGVTYQPGVVMVPAGPAAVRAASADGLTWTLDGRAEGVAGLKVGDVMVASARATGRVAAIEDQGESRIVTLAPVALTDIVRDGSIDLQQAIAPDAVQYQAIPGLVGASTPLGDGDIGVQTLHGLRGRAPRQAGGGDGELPKPDPTSVEIPVGGDWSVSPGYTNSALTLDVARDGLLKVFLHFEFPVSTLNVDAGVDIANGVIGGSRLVIEGIQGMDVDLQAGSAEDDANEKLRLEVPVEIDIPIPPSPATAGLPLDVKVTFAFSVATAITGNNSTVLATGKYGLSGPIGVRGGDVLAPEFTVEQSIIDSLSGITLGPSGVVFAVKMEVKAGIGIPAANAGPYGSITASLGVTNGSSLGASLARCKGATLDLLVGGGAEIALSDRVAEALKLFLPPGTELPEAKAEASVNVLHREQIVPDVPLCTSGLDDGGGGGGGG